AVPRMGRRGVPCVTHTGVPARSFRHQEPRRLCRAIVVDLARHAGGPAGHRDAARSRRVRLAGRRAGDRPASRGPDAACIRRARRAPIRWLRGAAGVRVTSAQWVELAHSNRRAERMRGAVMRALVAPVLWLALAGPPAAAMTRTPCRASPAPL